MIGMARQNRRGPVKLFQKHHANQLVRPGRGPKRQSELLLGPQIGRKSVRTTDHEDHVGCRLVAQAGQMPRQAARGLMWLTLARDSAGPDDSWIKESYNKAIAKASDEDRASALQMLEHWVQGRRD